MVFAVHCGVSDCGHATTGCTLASAYCMWGGSVTTLHSMENININRNRMNLSKFYHCYCDSICHWFEFLFIGFYFSV